MPKSKLPKPDAPLPPAPKRPWGHGSIEVRGRGYLARWREGDRAKTRLFGTIGEAEEHLTEVYPGPGRVAVSRKQIRVLITDWHQTATRLEASGATSAAQAISACAASLEDLLNDDHQ